MLVTFTGSEEEIPPPPSGPAPQVPGGKQGENLSNMIDEVQTIGKLIGFGVSGNRLCIE